MINDISKVLIKKEKNNEQYDWKSIENEKKIVFPEDYKRFLEYYGEGSINNFLWILSPISENPYLNSFKQLSNMKNSYEYMKNNNLIDYDYCFYDNGGGLFPWGITDNGDELFWNYLKDRIDIVVFSSRYEDIMSYKMSMESFLYGLLSGKIECDIFPEDFILDENFYVVDR